MILRRQLDKIKGEAVAAMKEAGLEYEQRMEELEKLEYPKPRREFVYTTFNEFAARHPWVGQENIRPKSIAREMFEEFYSFADYVRKYELQRSEGLLLRHLSSVHKILVQTVPDSAKTDPVREMEQYLGVMIRQVDSSLLDEWEKMRDPSFQAPSVTAELRPPGAEEAARDITRDSRAFLVAIRTGIFTLLRALGVGDFEQASSLLGSPEDPDGQPWTEDRFRSALDAYHVEHERICLDPEARNARHTHVLKADDEGLWTVQQVLVDPDQHCDWILELEVDLAKSRAAASPWVRLRRIGPMAEQNPPGAKL